MHLKCNALETSFGCLPDLLFLAESGCISEGNTKEEALNNIKEAIALYLEEVEDDSLMEESILEEVLV